MPTQSIVRNITKLKKQYNITVVESDMYKLDGVLYLSSIKTAALLGITYHHFSVYYVTTLLNSGVRRVTLGRSKFYCLSEIITRLNKAIEKDKTVLNICSLMFIK